MKTGKRDDFRFKEMIGIRTGATNGINAAAPQKHSKYHRKIGKIKKVRRGWKN
jgi:hypothetical protein